jgi:hypothetical protein
MARHDKFKHKPAASVGFFMFINPDIVFRDEFHATINKALQRLEINSKDFEIIFQSSNNRCIPTFEVGFGTVSYRDTHGKMVSTRSSMCNR